MKIENILDVENIFVNDTLTSKEEVIDRLTESLVVSKVVLDKEEFIESIYDRESRASTYVGEYLVIPHGTCKHIAKPAIAIAKVDREFSWGEVYETVKLVILFAIPEDGQWEEELEILKRFASSLGDSKFIKELLEADTEGELFQSVCKYLREK